jgi:hypothetical protein
MKTFEEWWEENDDECWISYHESGACYDTDYEDWCDHLYEIYYDHCVYGSE